jgi:hypothetical protein
MAIKDSGKVTVTFNRTTVEKLREEKGGMAWDDFMLNLIGSRKTGVRARCILCRKVVESGDVDLTASMLVKKLGWKEISVRGCVISVEFRKDDAFFKRLELAGWSGCELSRFYQMENTKGYDLLLGRGS